MTPAALAEHLTALAGAQRRRPRPGRARVVAAALRISSPASASPAADAAALNGIIARAEGNAYYAEELLAAFGGPAATEEHGPSRRPGGAAAEPGGTALRRGPARAEGGRGSRAAGRRRAGPGGLRACRWREYENAVREAVAQQLLVPDGADGYAFRHALLREAVYGDLLPGERTRLHGALAGLLADEERLAANPGTAAELAQHYLASHDIPGAFAASVRAGMEAERLGAPAEAHGHFDQALALWERVSDPEEAGRRCERGQLALYSAGNAAASGDVPRAVHQLRSLRAVLAAGPDAVLAAKAGERLALLPAADRPARPGRGGRRSGRRWPGPPWTCCPRTRRAWERARAIATYANALLARGGPHRGPMGRARAGRGPRRALAGRWRRTALVTLGLLEPPPGAERRGDQAVHGRARAGT